MRLMLEMTIGLSALALATAASARESAARPGCPSGYARLGEICISAASGDIVLPLSKRMGTASHARAER